MGSSSSSKSGIARGAQLVFDFLLPHKEKSARDEETTPAVESASGEASVSSSAAIDWREEATRATQDCIRLARSIWPELVLPLPIEIGFRLRGHAAGVACYKPPSIQYNAALLERYTSRFIDTIVPHEVAHLVVDTLYAKKLKPHGKEWKEVVKRLGGEPRATHEFETKAARRLRRYYYECGCEELHPLTGKSHRRARNGSTRYSCRMCAERIRFTGIEGYE